MNSDAEIEINFMKYVEALTEVSIRCPNAGIFISSVPPRKGRLNSDINVQISQFNQKLKGLAESEHNVTYIDNYPYLTDDLQTLDDLYEKKDDIHLSALGKFHVASSMFDAIKNMSFRDRLRNENGSYI